MNMKKVLVGYISDGKADGINSYVRNFCAGLKNQDVQVDFLTRSEDVSLSNLGFDSGKVHLVSRNRHPFKQLMEMKKIIKENPYDVAYFNISESYNCVGIIAAKLFKVKKIVVHSHSSGVEKESKLKGLISKLINSICKSVIVACADTRLACSKKAAEWLYTRNTVIDGDYKIIYNTVDHEKFKFDESIREKIRKEYELEDKFVIGHVGRFCYPKNHRYLIDVFKNVQQKKENAVLMCVGDGPDYENVKQYAEEQGVSDKIIFLGAVTNVSEILQAFDVFLLPSRFEGLPIVAVEAQFSGLPCVLSSNIDDNVVIAENTSLIPVGENDKEIWAETVLKCNSRENKLLKNADNYKLAQQKEQFISIACKESTADNNTLILDMSVKILLGIHYLLNITCLMNGFTWILPLAFLGMLGIVLFNIKNVKAISKDHMVRLLFAFMLSYGLTFILSTNYNVGSSIKIAIWLVVNFAFVFGFNKLKTRNQMIFEIDSVAKIFVLVCSILNVYNLMLLIRNVTKIVESFDGQPLLFGVAPWGRFYGNHYDPNYASVCFGCAIIMALYLMRKSRKLSGKILYGISIFLQSVYIIFAQSRTSRVAFLIGIVLYTLFMAARKQKKIIGIRSISGMVLVVCFVLVIPNATINAYNEIKMYTASSSGQNQDDEDDIDDEEEFIIIGREDVDSSDISNRRFDIWKSGIEISKSNIVDGIGFANIKPYALDKFPDTYLVNNDYKQFDAFHNMFMDVLVSQGILGIVIVFAIICYFAFKILSQIKRLFIEDENADTTIMLTSCLAIVLASSMFLSAIFYINNVCTYIFWLLLGYLYYFVKKKKAE